MMKPIQVTRSSMPDFEEFTEEIRNLWDNHWLTNMGEKHKRLEAELKEYLNVMNVTLFTNGHLALEAAIEALASEGEVITTPFTFASTTHAIVRNGLKPVFCDICYEDYTVDVDKIEALITDKTSAIIPVHVYGNVCDVDSIDKIAGKYGLKVLYDAAHAFGVKVDGRGIGDFGDASMFSFHATKVFNTIEGGAITCRSSSIQRALNNLKNYGITGIDSVESVGGNAKMNEFQAAMGICNLRHVDDDIKRRKSAVERYITSLGGTRGIKLLSPQRGVESNYAYLPVFFDGYKKSRDQVYEELKEQNIIARKYFYPLTNSFECYKDRFNPNDTPVAKYIAERILTLPLYPDLEADDIDRICEIVKE